MASKKKRYLKLILLGLVAAFIYFLFAGNNTIVDVYRSYRKIQQQEEEIQRMTLLNDSLKAVIRKLKEDTVYIERIAREKLGMAREGETIYKFIEEPKEK